MDTDTQAVRTLTLSAWVADYRPTEQIDFSDMALTDRSFQKFVYPDDQAGWNYFAPNDATLTINIKITDSLNRLGRIKIWDHASGTLVADIPATGATLIQGSFTRDSAVREYNATIYSTASAALFNLGIDIGKPEAVVPWVYPGGFKPYYPPPIGIPGIYVPTEPPVQNSDCVGVKNDPRSAPGDVSGMTGTGQTDSSASRSMGVKAFTNDIQTVSPLLPPGDFAFYSKRQKIADTVIADRFKVGDPSYSVALQNALAPYRVQDLTNALTNIDEPPYSTGAGAWFAYFKGDAAAVMAIPFERKRGGGLLDTLAGALVGTLQPARAFLSILASQAANSYIATNPGTKFRQGDVKPWGDVYSLNVSDGGHMFKLLNPILQNVTFTLSPNIPPTSGFGSGTLVSDGSWTNPPPPGPPTVPALSFSSASGWTTTVSMAKGYKYKATGVVDSPLGYEASITQPIMFFVPGSTSVSIPCTLKKLIELKVKTTAPNGTPASALVKVKQNGIVVLNQTTTLQGDGSYSYSFFAVSPGAYQVTATGGAPPGEGEAVAITVVPDKLLTVTVKYGSGIGPPPPPGP